MKKLLFTILVLIIMMSHVSALTSDGVTYDNKGNTEILTDTLDELLRDADVYKTGGSVTANQMLKGATGYAKGELVTGTIESKGAATYKPGTSNQTIGAGVYLSGAQTIEGDANLTGGNIAAGKSIFGVSGSFTSDANAAAGHILSGKTAYVNGTKITGTIPNKGKVTYTPSASNQTIGTNSYYEQLNIAGDADLIAGNIKSGVNIFGVNGTFTSDANAGAGHILSGRTAYVNGSKVTGTHTAQDHNFRIIKAEHGATKGLACGGEVAFNTNANGHILAWLSISSPSGGVSKTFEPSLMIDSVYGGSTYLKPSLASNVDDWSGGYLFDYEILGGQTVTIRAIFDFSHNNFKSCDLFIAFIE